jgi:hypothetical protein
MSHALYSGMLRPVTHRDRQVSAEARRSDKHPVSVNLENETLIESCKRSDCSATDHLVLCITIVLIRNAGCGSNVLLQALSTALLSTMRLLV